MDLRAGPEKSEWKMRLPPQLSSDGRTLAETPAPCHNEPTQPAGETWTAIVSGDYVSHGEAVGACTVALCGTRECEHQENR